MSGRLDVPTAGSGCSAFGRGWLVKADRTGPWPRATDKGSGADRAVTPTPGGQRNAASLRQLPQDPPLRERRGEARENPQSPDPAHSVTCATTCRGVCPSWPYRILGGAPRRLCAIQRHQLSAMHRARCRDRRVPLDCEPPDHPATLRPYRPAGLDDRREHQVRIGQGIRRRQGTEYGAQVASSTSDEPVDHGIDDHRVDVVQVVRAIAQRPLG